METSVQEETMLKRIILASLLAPSSAWAFCGHYVGGDLTNVESQLIVARQGKQTVLTMANDVQGDLADFGMIVPVPSTVTAEDISVVDPDMLDALDVYSAPRLVSYSCDDVVWVPDGEGGWEDQAPSSGGCGGSPSSVTLSNPDTAGSTEGYEDGGGLGEEKFEDVLRVERFTVGEYDLAVVSATDESGLSSWLSTEGFTLSGEADALLEEYIDAGLSFLVARVFLDEVPDDRPWLSPIQVRYEADMVSIPIRLGTLSSAGEQDVLIYTIAESGLMGISTYPEVSIESECLLEEDMSDYTDAALTEALQDEDTLEGTIGAGYLLEYGWASNWCDPCPPEGPLDDEVLEALGFVSNGKMAWVTRMHMRYEPDDITADLVLYESNVMANWQLRYIEYDQSLEVYWPVCDEGWVDEPGSCPEPTYSSDVSDYTDNDDVVMAEEETSTLCATAVVLNPLAVMLMAGVMRRRKVSESA